MMPVDEPMIVESLQRILAGTTFRNAPRCRELLAFVVTESLAGRGHLLNERVIARSALGRPPTIDTRTDAAARVQAGRTRDLLDRYYRDEGRDEVVRISIPRGQYAARFLRQPSTRPVEPAAVAPSSATRGPVLAVTQFRHRSGGLDRRVAVGLSESLVQVLSRFPGLRVVGPVLDEGNADAGADAWHAGDRARADAVLHGAVRTANETVRVTTHLTDQRTGTVRWSDTFERPVGEFLGFDAEDEILRHVAATVGDFGGVMLRERFEPAPGEGHAEVADALWRYYSFLEQLSPDEAIPVVVGLESALSLEPDNAHVMASLGFVFTCDVLMRGAAAADSIELAESHGRRALAIDPQNAVAHNVLAVVALARGQLPAAHRHAEVVLQLAGHHPGNAYVAGMVIGAAGDWPRGIDIIRETVRLNPYGPNHRHTLLAVDALLRDDVADALAEASYLHFPDHLYGPLLRSLCLFELGLADEARAELERAVEIEPGLADRAGEVLAVAPTIPLDVADHLAARLAALQRSAGK
jgi:TolB-like protein/tetratricopeptide (TPR) repeat protein